MGTVGIIVVYAVILGGMWFLLMRPQKKEQKRIQAMLADMEIGDTALTTSGFYGVIIDITDDDVIVEFGNNKNCRRYRIRSYYDIHDLAVQTARCSCRYRSYRTGCRYVLCYNRLLPVLEQLYTDNTRYRRYHSCSWYGR